MTATPKGYKTVDRDLEMKNFEQTGNVFADIWPELIIDGHPLVAKSVDEKTPTTTVHKSQ